MAERYATQSGIWEAATFNGGTLPQVGDTVHPNGYTVTIDRNVTVAALSTRAGAVAAGGGYFALTNATAGVTITAAIYGGTARCLLDGHTTGTINIIGNIYGSDTTASAFGLAKNSTGLTVLTGNSYGGSIVTGSAISLSGADVPFIQYGNCYGATANVGSAHGVAFSCTGTSLCVIYGNLYGGASPSSSYGISNGSTSSAAAVVVYGNIYGDASPGILASQAAPTYIYGDSVGGISYLIAGATLHTTSTGNLYLYGTSRSSATGAGPGVANNSTTTGCAFIQAAEQGAGGGWPYSGKVVFIDLNNIYFGIRNSAGTIKTIGVTPHSPFMSHKIFGAT